MRKVDLKIILNQMFLVVGEEYEETYTTDVDWYLRHSWTVEEEEKFKNWLISYLKSCKMFRPREKAEWFLLCYGWKTRGDVS
jgi:hypothetical protein